jgi:hypothetical protein
MLVPTREVLTMKKILIILPILLIFFSIRFIFSYTILSVPYMFGTRTYENYSKYFFPICIMNPLKIKKVKIDIVHYLENTEIQDYLKKAGIHLENKGIHLENTEIRLEKIGGMKDYLKKTGIQNKLYREKRIQIQDSLYEARLSQKHDSLYIAELIRKVFISIRNPSDFDIISFENDEIEESFLLQIKKSKEECVVFRDKKTEQIIRFGI